MDELSETVEIDFDNPVPGDTRAYQIRNGEGDSLWIEDLESAVTELENAADSEGLLFDREAVTRALVELAPGDEPFRFADWSAEVHTVDANWIAQLPEHDGW